MKYLKYYYILFFIFMFLVWDNGFVSLDCVFLKVDILNVYLKWIKEVVMEF